MRHFTHVGRAALMGTAIVLIGGGLPNCAARRPVQIDRGIPRCSFDSVQDLLSTNTLQCWFDAPHGRWRRLSHESHYDVLVVQIEASDIRDADEIARLFVSRESGTFSEILIYAHAESATGSPRIRRVRWTRDAGFEVLEFTAPAA